MKCDFKCKKELQLMKCLLYSMYCTRFFIHFDVFKLTHQMTVGKYVVGGVIINILCMENWALWSLGKVAQSYTANEWKCWDLTRVVWVQIIQFSAMIHCLCDGGTSSPRIDHVLISFVIGGVNTSSIIGINNICIINNNYL